MNKSNPKHFKIALYIRVSTEEQAENPEGSIRNQEERLRQTVRHEQEKGKSCEITGVFVDAGLSAKNMNRPSLQKLLRAIREGEVNLVMVTELSRLSRNTKDFCEMWEFFQTTGCEFHSLREHFDTTNAAGELMLKSFANFAEFERRQTAERISASFKIRAERGLFNGGPIPFGYKLSNMRGKLDVETDEAAVVNAAFKAYLDQGTLSSACVWLNTNGFSLRKISRGRDWTKKGQFNFDNLHSLLTNKLYVGIKVFSTKEGKKEVKASWDAIIDDVTFARVQEKLSKNHRTKKPESHQRYPFLLSEIIYCGTCGDKLSGKSAHGKCRKHPYYEHGRRTKIQLGFTNKIYNCNPHRIPAGMAEEIVWKDIEQILSGDLSGELLASVNQIRAKNHHTKEIERLKNKIYSINSKVDALTLRLAELPREVSASPIYKQMEVLAIQKKELDEKILLLKNEELEKELPTDAISYEKLLSVLNELTASGITTAKKQKIITSLIERIEVFPDRLEIAFGLGSSKIKQELVFASSLLNQSENSNFPFIKCSTSLTNGGTNRT